MWANRSHSSCNKEITNRSPNDVPHGKMAVVGLGDLTASNKNPEETAYGGGW